MSAIFMPNGKMKFFDSNGDVLAGGKLYTYEAGTVIPRATYVDEAMTIPNTNPVVLDIRGEALVRWSGAYKYVVTTDAGVVIDTIDNFGSSQDLSSSTGSSYVGFLQAGAGAVAYTLQAKDRQILSVADFGAVGDGSDETIKLRAAALAAELRGCALFWPATPLGYKCQMITFTIGNVEMIGQNTKIVQTVDASCHSIGGADYTVSAVFFFRPGAHKCNIRGFQFSQDATFAALPVTYTGTSNFSPIVVYRSDYITIDGCIFNCSMGRGIQFRGGNFGRIGDNNTFINCGLTAAVGFTADAYYGDAVGIAVPFYSPIGLHVGSVKVFGSSLNVLARTSIHLTGCNDFTLDSPIVNGLNDATQVAIRIYSSDFGVTDISGNIVGRMAGLVISPQVRGVCTHGLQITLDGGGTDPIADIVVSNPVIDVTGIGIFLERFPSGKILGAHVRASASPLWFGDSVEMSEITGYYECTTLGTSGRTVFAGSTAEMVGINWHDMTIVMAAADDYAFDTVGVTIGPKGANFDNILIVANTTSVASRILQLSECGGSVNLSNITIDVRGAGISNRFLFSITEAAGAVLSVSGRDVKDISTNGTAYTRRGCTVNASDDVSFVNCDFGGMDITCTRDVLIEGCRVVQNRAGTPLTVNGAALVKVSDSHIEASVAGNVLGAEFIACGKTKIHHSSVVTTNSTQPSIRATTSGVVEADKVDISNAGTGVPYAVTGTGLIAGDLGAYYKDATLWIDANRLLPTIMQPGTTLWHSVDLMPEYSDGANWRTPAGAIT